MTYQAPEVLDVGNAQDVIQQDKVDPDSIDPFTGQFTWNLALEE